MKLILHYIPINWNKYINAERRNLHIANKIKQADKKATRELLGNVYDGKYPVELIIKQHYKAKNSDLDNMRYKGIIDGLVANGVIKNDNLTKIQKITLLPVFDKEEIMEIEIKEIQ